jgi:hypothetical protein|tara:strand:+ start:363 stop:533 length:171 start_codon:yes stop_codon:yes gene_type:complete
MKSKSSPSLSEKIIYVWYDRPDYYNKTPVSPFFLIARLAALECAQVFNNYLSKHPP